MLVKKTYSHKRGSYRMVRFDRDSSLLTPEVKEFLGIKEFLSIPDKIRKGGSMDKVNGWTNRNTWRTNLWLNNDENNYRALQSIIIGAGDRVSLLKRLTQRAMENNPIMARELTDLSDVNWEEILTLNKEK